MNGLGYILCVSLVVVLEAAKFLLAVRAILTFFPLADDSKIAGIINNLTEPIVAPIRVMLERSAFADGMVFDFSIIVAYLILELITMFIGF